MAIAFDYRGNALRIALDNDYFEQPRGASIAELDTEETFREARPPTADGIIR